MKKQLSEKQVLNKLGIENFRHLSKDNVMSFASMLPEMNPEVAKKALEQFPRFASTVLEIMKEYKSTVDQAISEGSKNANQSYAAYNAVMDALEKSLEDEEITFEERMQIIEKMNAVAREVDAKGDKQNKFLMQNIMVLGAVVLGGVGILASVLGGNTKIGDLDS